jgi:Flp pilus assembly protein TadD
MAEAQAAFLEGNMRETIKAARNGLQGDKGNYVLLAILGSALLRNGATPGEPEFDEALKVTREAVAERPREPDSQVTLGRLYLMAGKTKKAIAHLEVAMELDPENRAACMQLATAYRQSGDMAKARKMFELLAQLNERKQGSGMGDGRPARKIPHPRR